MAVTVTVAGCGDAFGTGGRFNTCFVVRAPEVCFAIDFGASSLVALNRAGIDHNEIDAVVLTHWHGDHCGGVPFLLLDAMLGARRRRPLNIVGPPGTEARLATVRDALFPGSDAMRPRFELRYLETEPCRAIAVGAHLRVTAFPAAHTPSTNPTSVRCEAGGRIVAYTGDSAWTEHMPELARDADLLICESYGLDRAFAHHLNYPDVRAHRHELGAKRILLTHFGREMLAARETVPEDCAHDGLVIEL